MSWHSSRIVDLKKVKGESIEYLPAGRIIKN